MTRILALLLYVLLISPPAVAELNYAVSTADTVLAEAYRVYQ